MMHRGNDRLIPGWRHLFRLGLAAVLFALFFWLVLRLPFTSSDESSGSSVKPTGPVYADARRPPITSAPILFPQHRRQRMS